MHLFFNLNEIEMEIMFINCSKDTNLITELLSFYEVCRMLSQNPNDSFLNFEYFLLLILILQKYSMKLNTITVLLPKQ